MMFVYMLCFAEKYFCLSSIPKMHFPCVSKFHRQLCVVAFYFPCKYELNREYISITDRSIITLSIMVQTILRNVFVRHAVILF